MNNLDKTNAVDVADPIKDYDCEKRNWILTYGSELLQASLLAGYTSDCRYVEERLKLELPGFLLPTDISIKKTDSPPAYCLKACSGIVGSYCSEDCWRDKEYYLTIDNYLGKHTIVKKIAAPIEPVHFELGLAVKESNDAFDDYELDKRDWIFNFGSDLLQLSIVSNYESDIRYVLERSTIEHPGFYLSESHHQRTDSPPEYCLEACLREDSTSYVSQVKYHSDNYYITIDNFLGKHQIVKKIDELAKTTEVKLLDRRETKSRLSRFFTIAIVTSFFGTVGCTPLFFALIQHSPFENHSQSVRRY